MSESDGASLGPVAPVASPRVAIAGLPIDRRTLLRGALRTAARAGCAIGIPGALAGCATYVRMPPAPFGYGIFVADPPPGVPGMIAARAATLGVTAPVAAIPLVDGRVGGAIAEATRGIGSGTFNPAFDEYPRVYNLIVVQGDAGMNHAARILIGQGVKIVTYLSPLRYQTAQINVDTAALAMLLATDAAAWARDNVHGRTSALFVGAPPAPITPGGDGGDGPPAESFSVEEQAVRTAFTRLLPSVRITTVANLEDPIRALDADPDLRIVLCAEDYTAYLIAQALREQRPQPPRGRVYIGGLGGPSVGSGLVISNVEQVLEELRRDDALRAVATVRLGDLANALVDLPVALLRNQAPYNVNIPPILLTPGSAELATYARDSLR